MIRSLILASAIAFTGAAQAAPQLIGSGDNAQLVYDGTPGNVVGGGSVQFRGGEPDPSFTYGGMLAQPGLEATIVGADGKPQISYAAPAAAPSHSLAQTRGSRTRG